MDEIVTQTKIEASPAKVWEFLIDFDSYPEWNPSLDIDGDAKEGSQLEVTFKYPNQSPTTMKTTVLVVDEPTELRWDARLFIPYLYDGEHRFVLTPLDDGERTRLVQAESFKGLLVGFVNRRIGDDIEEGFRQMNERLKEHVEGTTVDGPNDVIQDARTE
ncbi:SRPBCC family protein [Halorussus sp. AFM4]|uniref:SRPBCC family protein n=1 Tax=Halorussus sp. AFM4 TaxID=3421651 RepID=UPI003EBD5C4F